MRRLCGALAAAALIVALSCCGKERLPDVPPNYANMLANIGGAQIGETGNALLIPISTQTGTTLYEYDVSTGDMYPFCQDAACPHTTDKCAALGARVNFISANGTLYAMGGTGDVKYMICKLEGKRFVPVLEDTHRFFIAGEQTLFIDSESMCKRYTKDPKKAVNVGIMAFARAVVIGEYLYFSDGYALKRYPLTGEAQEPETVLEKCGLFSYDGSHIYFVRSDSGYNAWMRCTIDGQDVEAVVDMPCSPGINFDDEYIYFGYKNFNDYFDEKNGNFYKLKKDLSSAPVLLYEGLLMYEIYTSYLTDDLIVTNGDEISLVKKNGSGMIRLDELVLK